MEPKIIRYFNKKNIWISLSVLLVILAIILPWMFYNAMPYKITLSWQINNTPNSKVAKIWIFSLPLIIIFMDISILLIKYIDPWRKNILKFETWYNSLIFFLSLFISIIESAIIFKNIGYNVNIVTWSSFDLAILIIYLAFLIKHAEPNWFIGIRTPWTMTNKRVWKKTHYLGFYLLLISSASFFLSSLNIMSLELSIWLLIGVFVILILYSYILSIKKI